LCFSYYDKNKRLLREKADLRAVVLEMYVKQFNNPLSINVMKQKIKPKYVLIYKLIVDVILGSGKQWGEIVPWFIDI